MGNSTSSGLPELGWPKLGWAFLEPDEFAIISHGSGAQPSRNLPIWSWAAIWGTLESGDFFDYACKSFEDPFCRDLAENNDAHWEFNLLAPSCPNALPGEQCIEGLALVNASGERRVALPLGEVPAPKLPANRQVGLPQGATASLYENPFTDDTDDGFLVSLSGDIATDWESGLPDPQLWGKNGTGFAPKTGFQLNVVAYSLVPGDYSPASWRSRTEGVNDQRTGGDPCVFFLEGSCGWRVDFDPDVTLEVSFQNHRFSTVDTDWLGARIGTASFDQVPLGKGMERVVISGKAMRVPQVLTRITKDEASAELLDLWYQLTPCGSMPSEACPFQTSRVLGNDEASARLLVAFQSAAQDRSVMALPVWSVWTESADSMVAALGSAARNCKSLRDGRILGLVSTNATLFTPGPPKLVNGVLKYGVTGLHYLEDGSVFRGTYDLIMDGEFVRCMYELAAAPIYATIEVTSADGPEAQVVSTSVSERRGMLHMRASGFTFSSPQISVRVLGKSAKRTTIKCKKGNQVTKVTGVTPRCPKGWVRI
jgi:hypothetical protein